MLLKEMCAIIQQIKTDFTCQTPSDYIPSSRGKMPPKAKSTPKGGVKKGKKVVKRSKKRMDSIQDIKKPPITRLFRKAGAIRTSSLIFEEVRGELKTFLVGMISRINAITSFAGRATVQEQDVRAAISSYGLHPAVGLAITHPRLTKSVIYTRRGDGKSKEHRFKPGTVSLREIRFYQKNSDTLVIPRQPMKRLIREIMDGFRADVRFTEKAMLLIHAVCEEFLVRYMHAAVYVAVTADGRKSIFPKDLQAVRKIASDPVLCALFQGRNVE